MEYIYDLQEYNYSRCSKFSCGVKKINQSLLQTQGIVFTQTIDA